MPQYAYVARSSSGAALSGELVAGTELEAARLLRADGKYVVKLTARAGDRDPAPAEAIRGAASLPALGRSRIRPDDVILFITQLSIMVDTGVGLAGALRGILAQTPPGRFGEVQKDLLRTVESGQPFSAGLARHPGVFSPMTVNLLRAAEASGTVALMLKRCAEHMANQREIRRRVRSAMIYPLVLIVSAAGVTAFLMAYVLPKFTAIYAGKEAVLPIPTQWLIGLSNGIVGHWRMLVGVTLALVVGAIWFFRSAASRRHAHALVLALPMVGSLLRKSFITSSLRTLGILVDSGVSMLEAVAMARATVPNDQFERMWSEVEVRLHRGEQLSAPLYQSPLMPRTLVQMLEAGERAGQLGPVLKRVADHLDQDLRLVIKNTTQLIEPLMIAVMGAIVGAVSIALLLPILSISKVIGQ